MHFNTSSRTTQTKRSSHTFIPWGFLCLAPSQSSSHFWSLVSTKKFSSQTRVLTINFYWQSLLTKSLSLFYFISIWMSNLIYSQNMIKEKESQNKCQKNHMHVSRKTNRQYNGLNKCPPHTESMVPVREIEK